MNLATQEKIECDKLVFYGISTLVRYLMLNHIYQGKEYRPPLCISANILWMTIFKQVV